MGNMLICAIIESHVPIEINFITSVFEICNSMISGNFLKRTSNPLMCQGETVASYNNEYDRGYLQTRNREEY